MVLRLEKMGEISMANLSLRGNNNFMRNGRTTKWSHKCWSRHPTFRSIFGFSENAFFGLFFLPIKNAHMVVGNGWKMLERNIHVTIIDAYPHLWVVEVWKCGFEFATRPPILRYDLNLVVAPPTRSQCWSDFANLSYLFILGQLLGAP